MPAHNPHKVQLNLFVDKTISESFRDEARKIGLGGRPSPMLARLLALHIGNTQALFRRMSQLAEDSPGVFATDEQRFYLRKLRSLIDQVLAGEAPESA